MAAEPLLAEQKFSCPSCGAEATWSPAKQALVCGFCGTQSPVTLDPGSGAIVEHDLAAALRELPDSARGWGQERTSVQCQSCQAVSVFPPSQVAQRCPFCGSAQWVPYAQVKAPIRPESLLPFKIAEPQARDLIRDWYGKVWFAPNALKQRAKTDTVHGIYLPYWTFDAQAHAEWSADRGVYYYEEVAYQNSQGQTEYRRERRTEWMPASGTLDHFFDDELVCASVGVHGSLLRGVEPFPTQAQLVPYSAGYVAGWPVEGYQIDLIRAAAASRQQMDAQLTQRCAQQVGGDTYRNLSVDADYSAQTFKHILAPLWLLTFRYGNQPYQVVINGFTGKVAGNYPKSWIKISLAVLGALVLLLLWWMAMGNRQ